MRSFTPKQLVEYLAKAEPPPLLLDVREPWEFDICHLDNAVLIPMGSIPNQLQHIDPAQEIVLICHHGVRSRRVGFYLQQHGFLRLINLEGGVDAWARDVDFNMATY
ncbi:MAG: rhodanese-like domain-containing protein [Gammaproteobacteria bacterium]|nr:rhodanese-like domain-containing protein [Gammaproteobacteria bacterium]